VIDSERFNPTPVHARGAALSGRAGFSLVELLVVIAVVGVLVSILMPALAVFLIKPAPEAKQVA